MDNVFTLISLIAAPLLLTALFIPMMKRLAWSFGLVDHPADGAHKSHQRPVPYGGGLAIFLSTLLLLLVFLLLILRQSLSDAEPGTLQALPFAQIRHLSTLLASASVLFLVGLVDDWRGLPALARFLMEIAVAAILVLGVPAFRLVFLGDHLLVAGPLTILWIVALTNAFNFLDNMDGLTAGIASIALGLLALIALCADHLPGAALSLVLLGATSGFLLYNFSPASVFMGDAGGLFLGFLASGLSVLLSHHLGQAGADFPRQFAPLVVLTVPLYDLVSVVLIRLKNQVAPWIGDNNHISHRLVDVGLSRRRAVLAIYLLTLLTGLPGLFLLWTRSWTAWLLLLLVLVFAGLMARLDLAARRHRPHRPA